MAMPICFRLLVQDMRAAASRTFWTAGRSRPMRTAMIAITTSSSISVKPRRRTGGAGVCMGHLDEERNGSLRPDGVVTPSGRVGDSRPARRRFRGGLRPCVVVGRHALPGYPLTGVRRARTRAALDAGGLLYSRRGARATIIPRPRPRGHGTMAVAAPGGGAEVSGTG